MTCHVVGRAVDRLFVRFFRSSDGLLIFCSLGSRSSDELLLGLVLGDSLSKGL